MQHLNQEYRMSYEPTDADVERMYRLIGFKIENKMEGAIIEEGSSGMLFVKFMSDGGKKDDVNGLELQKYLTANGVKFKSDHPRSLSMGASSFKKLFGKTTVLPVQKEHDLGVKN
jgi:hypothetical protein